MLGSVVLVLPVNFQVLGVVSAISFMIPIGIFCWKTASWIALHSLTTEDDMAIPVDRLTGKAWMYTYLVSSIVDVFLVVIIYYNLLNKNLYPLINAILELSGLEPGVDFYVERTPNVWDKWSINYLYLITAAMCLPLMIVRDIRKIIRMAVFGFWAMVIYIVFIVYIFIENLVLDNGNKLI